MGTGETAGRLFSEASGSDLVGLDGSTSMLAAARGALPPERVELHVGRLEDPLPPGPFDLVVSALAVHHLPDEAKADLFRRIRAVGDRFVLGDVVVPEDPADAVISLTPSSTGRAASIRSSSGYGRPGSSRR